jgi:GNAT superfamily N-acetyltransferase
MLVLRPYDDAHDRPLVRAWLDSPQVARWFTERDDGLTDAELDRWRDATDLTAWVAEREGQPVGFGALRVSHAAGYVLLCHLLVDPTQRGQGIGTALTRALAARALADHPGWPVYTRITPDNLPAILAYPAAGFAPLEPLPPEYDERFLWLVWLADDNARVPGGWIDQ